MERTEKQKKISEGMMRYWRRRHKEESNKNKKCPFCGHEKIEIFSDSDPEYYKNTEYYTECQNCLSQGPMSHNKEEALKSWNRRK